MKEDRNPITEEEMVQIFFDDLKEPVQQELLSRFNLRSKKGNNWDTVPVAIIPIPDIEEFQSICSQCGQKTNDEEETVFDEHGDPFCKECFEELFEEKERKND